MNNASEKSGENGFACTRNNITSIVFVEGQSASGNPIPLSLVGAILSKISQPEGADRSAIRLEAANRFLFTFNVS